MVRLLTNRVDHRGSFLLRWTLELLNRVPALCWSAGVTGDGDSWHSGPLYVHTDLIAGYCLASGRHGISHFCSTWTGVFIWNSDSVIVLTTSVRHIIVGYSVSICG